MARSPQYVGMRISRLLQSLACILCIKVVWLSVLVVVLFACAANAQWSNCPGGVCAAPNHQHRQQPSQPTRPTQTSRVAAGAIPSIQVAVQWRLPVQEGNTTAYTGTQVGIVIGTDDAKQKSLIVTPAHGTISTKGWTLSILTGSQIIPGRMLVVVPEREVAFVEIDKPLHAIFVDASDSATMAFSSAGSLKSLRVFSDSEFEAPQPTGRAMRDGDSGTPFWSNTGKLIGMMLGGRGDTMASINRVRLARASSIVAATQEHDIGWAYSEGKFLYRGNVAAKPNLVTATSEFGSASLTSLRAGTTTTVSGAGVATVEPTATNGASVLPEWYFDPKPPTQPAATGFKWTWLACAKHGRSHWFECSGGGTPVPQPIPMPVPGPAGPAGPRGPAGADGKDGQVTEEQIRQIIEAVMANVKNGKDGRDGVDGAPGVPGVPGERGAAGARGERGEKGDPGDAAEIDDVVADVLKKLPPITVHFMDRDGIARSVTVKLGGALEIPPVMLNFYDDADGDGKMSASEVYRLAEPLGDPLRVETTGGIKVGTKPGSGK